MTGESLGDISRRLRAEDDEAQSRFESARREWLQRVDEDHQVLKADVRELLNSMAPAGWPGAERLGLMEERTVGRLRPRIEQVESPAIGWHIFDWYDGDSCPASLHLDTAGRWYRKKYSTTIRISCPLPHYEHLGKKACDKHYWSPVESATLPRAREGLARLLIRAGGPG